MYCSHNITSKESLEHIHFFTAKEPLAFAKVDFIILLRCRLCRLRCASPRRSNSQTVNGTPKKKNWFLLSFGTWGAVFNFHSDGKVFVARGGGGLLALVVITVVVVVVVLDTRDTVAVVLDQRSVAQLKLIQFLPQLIPLLLLLLLPTKTNSHF